MRHDAETNRFPFTFQDYTLYMREVEVRPGVRRRLWFFAKQQPKSAVPAAQPAGFRVAVDPRGGVPFLRPDDSPAGNPWPLPKGAPHPSRAAGHKAS
jgi:hypothetical protein